MYINVSPVIRYWYTGISNTTSITGDILIYMHIKHYKYNWWNIDIHEYKTRHAQLVKHWYRWISNIFMYINVSPVIFVVFDMHVYQYLTSYTCSVWYSCISISHQLYVEHYTHNWWDIDIQEYQTLQV
jgi:hypothetical protein